MKKILSLIFISTLILLASNSCARFKNKVAADGSFWGSTKSSWIVIKQSGGTITDVWKLEDQFVQSEAGSDGWLFVDQNGNPVHVGGDMKAIRVDNIKDQVFNSYIEYHMEHDSLTYSERYFSRFNGEWPHF